MTTGPDQGFAWVVALACFFINFIMAGLARTAGVLFVAIIDLYGVSREAATTPFSIRVCVRNITGPLVGLLGQKYGIRGVTTIGGFVAGMGSILCYFAPNVFWMTMFWGVIHGLGFGLSTVLHMIVVGQYFDKYKASALGLGYSGDCFGTFAFPVMIEYLISAYDVRGTFLIMGGIVMNVIPMALLLRKPPWMKENDKKRKLVKNIEQAEKECSVNQKILINNKENKPSNIDLEFKNSLKDDTLKSENNGSPKQNFSEEIFSGKINLSGHCNRAFQSSDTDLKSLGNETEISARKIVLELENSSGQEAGLLLTVSLQNSNLNQNSNTSCESLEVASVESEKTSCRNMNSHMLNESSLYEEINRKNRSVSDLNEKIQYISCISKCNRFSKMQNLSLPERRDSLPPVLERDLNFKKKSTACNEETSKKCDGLKDLESSLTDETSKNRTSSFVGQVAQEIVHRMRTASFASQVAQDGFITAIPQDCKESEPESECELKAIVEHKDHDVETCTNKGLIFIVDRDIANSGTNNIGHKDEHVIQEEPPNVLKTLLRTNTKPIFILISISMAVYAFLFVAVLTIIIDYAVDLGIPNNKGKYLVIGFSVADLIGRLGFGQVLDRKLMKMKNYFGCTMLLMGTLVAVIPLNVSFNYMMVCMCMYGLVQGGTAIVFPILVNMYMDKNSESVAMGCLNFYGGILILLMAPMIGFFRDNTGSYNYVFYIIGGVVAVVGIAWQFEPMILKFQNKKLREKYIMKEKSVATSHL